MQTLKDYLIGFLSALLAVLGIYLVGRMGRSGESDKSSENAQKQAEESNLRFDELQTEKDAVKPVEPTDEDSESYWKRELDK
jgi:hypothetical protein